MRRVRRGEWGAVRRAGRRARQRTDGPTARRWTGGGTGALRETEEPIVRPYWLVDDIEAAVAAAVKAGGVIAHPPLKIPGHGTFAIYIQGGINHGFWQR